MQAGPHGDYWTQVYAQQAMQAQAWPVGVGPVHGQLQVPIQYPSPKTVPGQAPAGQGPSTQPSPLTEAQFDPDLAAMNFDRRFSTQSIVSDVQPMQATPASRMLRKSNACYRRPTTLTLATAAASMAEIQSVPQIRTPASDQQPKVPKTNLKRSYQQAIKEEPSMQTLAIPQAPGMEQTTSADSGSNGESGKENKKIAGGHNAVEQKYRRGINDSLIMLREIVPALGHLRAAPGAQQATRKLSQFSLAASVTPAAPAAYVDGVPAPKKLSKQLILVTATDYIRYLKSRRDELEGEVASLKAALNDCVEDSSVVLSLHEARWAPGRAKILDDRQAIYSDREQAKASGRKRSKVDQIDGTADNQVAAKNSEDEDDSDEDEDGEHMADIAVSSAVAAKGQVRARGKATTRKAAGAGGAKQTNAARSAARHTQTAGPPKALMSVFAGASFIGGAGYDLIYGASDAQQAASPETARVWSQGLVRRSAVFTDAAQNVTGPALHPLQTFFIERPALLSGLVMVALSVTLAFLLLSVLPTLWGRVRGSSKEQLRANARQSLLVSGRLGASMTLHEERISLSVLAASPASSIGQIVRLPFLITTAIWWALCGSSPSHFTAALEEGELEQVAASIRLLEHDMANVNRLSFFTSLLHLYVLVRSEWPCSTASVPLLARAEAVLGLAFASSSAGVVRSAAARFWKSAQSRLKKDGSDARRPAWLGMALAMPLREARGLYTSSSANQRPLEMIAAAKAEQTLLNSWTALFTDVMDATLPAASENEAGSVTPKPTRPFAANSDAAGRVDDVLSAVPKASHLAALAHLYNGVIALGCNRPSLAIGVARIVAPQADKLASVRAFCSLVDNRRPPIGNFDASSPLDKLAYSVIAWLSVRQTVSAGGTAADTQEKPVTCDNELQAMTVELRRLLASEPFAAEGASEAFTDAQERYVEGLVSIGRRASGLQALEDSGCEL